MIVTGASRGIGAAIARLAAAQGFLVAVNYATHEEEASAVVSAIRALGGQAIAVQADVSTEDGVVRLFETADRELSQPLTALINNAGVSGGYSRVDQISAEALRRAFSVNVAGAFLCAREAIRRMSTRNGGRGGSIINISSRAAQIGGAGEYVHYAASKGALDTFTVGLAREVVGEGIRVNAIAAGLIETEFHATAGNPDRVRMLAPELPMGRAGAAEEVAEAVLWLASPAASYVTGAILPVSGGR